MIPKPWSGVDPATNGLRVVVDSPTGPGGLDVTIGGGAGWKTNAAGTRWTYGDPTGAVARCHAHRGVGPLDGRGRTGPLAHQGQGRHDYAARRRRGAHHRCARRPERVCVLDVEPARRSQAALRRRRIGAALSLMPTGRASSGAAATKPPIFSSRAVAALFLQRQHLDRPRARRLTAAGLARFAEDTGGIQLDSINVVDRAHYLTLWSRFGPYDRRALDRLIYRRRVLFEYWAHVACLISTDHLPAWRRAMLDYQHRRKGWAGFLRRHPRLMRDVEAAIRERGPLGNAAFQEARPTGASGWWNWKPATHALDFLWMSGRTTVHSRTHFQKRFDLLERVLPAAVAREPLDAKAFRRWHIERSLHAMGAATETDLRMYLTFPRTGAAERAAIVREMVRVGEVVEIAVAGHGTRWYALARDLASLAAAGRRRVASRGATLLSPFDSFLWHRERIERLFGYDYRIEARSLFFCFISVDSFLLPRR